MVRKLVFAMTLIYVMGGGIVHVWRLHPSLLWGSYSYSTD